MARRLPPKVMAKKLVRVLRPQRPDYGYLKKVFQHIRAPLAVTSPAVAPTAPSSAHHRGAHRLTTPCGTCAMRHIW